MSYMPAGADSNYVKSTGDEMTGSLTMRDMSSVWVEGTVYAGAALQVDSAALVSMGASRVRDVGTPTATTDGATKGYVDTGDSLKVSKSGDTMTGRLTIDAPAEDGGGSGGLTINRDAWPEIWMYKSSAPADRRLWSMYVAGNPGATGANEDSLSLAPKTDSLINGPAFRFHRDGRLQVGADPTAAMEVATKRYVDDHPSAYLCLAGAQTLTDVAVPMTWMAVGGFPAPDSGMWSSANPTRLLCPRTGWYSMAAMFRADSLMPVHATAQWEWKRNGARIGLSPTLTSYGTTGALTGSAAMTWSLNAGDYIEVLASRGNGATGGTLGAGYSANSVSWRYLGP